MKEPIQKREKTKSHNLPTQTKYSNVQTKNIGDYTMSLLITRHELSTDQKSEEYSCVQVI